jgi:uncharacterized membrane protein YidH (DUF202 family)
VSPVAPGDCSFAALSVPPLSSLAIAFLRCSVRSCGTSPSFVMPLGFVVSCITTMLRPWTPLSSLPISLSPFDLDIDLVILRLFLLASAAICWKRFSNQYSRRKTTNVLIAIGLHSIGMMNRTICCHVFKSFRLTVFRPLWVAAPLERKMASMYAIPPRG